MTEALVFDMDGTIVDNMMFHQRAWIDFLGRYNIQLLPEEFKTQNHGTIEEMIARFFGKDLTAERISALGLEKEAMYRSLYEKDLSELKGFSPLLKEAKRRGLKIGLATMGNQDNIDFILDGLQVRGFFDIIAGGHHIKYGKPHPEIYELILSALNVAADSAIAFEDTKGGVISATEAGLKVVGICTSHTPEEFRSWGVSESVGNFEEFMSKYF